MRQRLKAQQPCQGCAEQTPKSPTRAAIASETAADYEARAQALKDAKLAAIRAELGPDASAVDLHQRVLEVVIADVLDLKNQVLTMRSVLSEEQLAHRATRQALIGVIGRLRYYTRHNAHLRKLGNQYDAIERRQQERERTSESAGAGGDVADQGPRGRGLNEPENGRSDQQDEGDNQPRVERATPALAEC